MSHRNRRRRPLVVESLEARAMLTLAPSFSCASGVLTQNLNGKTSQIAADVTSYRTTSLNEVVYLTKNGSLFKQAPGGAPMILGRLVSSFTVTAGNQVNAVDWFNRNLSDAGIAGQTRADYTRNGFVSFMGMLRVFNQALQGGVTTAELQNLQTIYASARTLGMPEYVRNLTGKVLNPSSNNVAYLRSYYSNSPSTPLLGALVNQWFGGSVQPDAATPPPGKTSINPKNAYTPVGATGYKLYGPGGPAYTDVNQGGAGSCWFLASLAATVARNPSCIKNMFIANPNGTWSVRFYVNGAPDYVTVNNQLPIASADPSFNNGFANASPVNGSLWAPLAEKAFALENLSGQVTTQQQGVASYAAIDGGFPSWGLSVITGLGVEDTQIQPGASASSIATTIQNGYPACVWTGPAGSNPNLDSHVVPGHAYAVVGYDPSAQLPFHLFNPWGVTTYKRTNGAIWGQIWADADFLEENFLGQGLSGAAAPAARRALSHASEMAALVSAVPVAAAAGNAASVQPVEAPRVVRPASVDSSTSPSHTIARRIPNLPHGAGFRPRLTALPVTNLFGVPSLSV